MRVKAFDLVKSKPLDRKRLVLVDTLVVTKNGSYNGRRWKSPLEAIQQLRHDFTKQGIEETELIKFKSKEDPDKQLTEKELIASYIKAGRPGTLQQYTRDHFTIVRTGEDKEKDKDKDKAKDKKLIRVKRER